MAEGQLLNRAEGTEAPYAGGVIPGRTFLMRESEDYQNYGYLGYENYDTMIYPYTTERRNFYDSFGNYLIRGFDVFQWMESRTLAPQPGSFIWKLYAEAGAFTIAQRYKQLFDEVVVARESGTGWKGSFIVADEIRTQFTPLTLRLAGLNGVRGDVLTTNNALSVIASRPGTSLFWGGSHWGSRTLNYVESGVFLLGGHFRRKVGLLNIGATYVNEHIFDSMVEEKYNSIRGTIPHTYPIPTTIAVRFSDDSPEDGRGGPIVLDVNIYVNGEKRDDIVPFVMKQSSLNPTVVGRLLSVTNQFLRTLYYVFRDYQYWFSEIPFYADYFYFKDHVEGEDVSKNVNIDEMNVWLEQMDPSRPMRADGYDYIIYYYDLSQIPLVESVSFDALVANDYKVEVSELHVRSQTSAKYEDKYQASFFQTVARCPGNVQDGSNLKRISFDFGMPTGLAVYSVNLNTNIKGIRINAEYANSIDYMKYPATFSREKYGKRHTLRSEAYYINMVKNSGRFDFGAEYFSIDPSYNVELMATGVEDRLAQDSFEMRNNLGFWPLIEDNDDNDRFPDRYLHQVYEGYRSSVDVDGVFPGKDENRDGIPDTNQNLNSIPDYAEPFLMYWVEPDEFVYGTDLNNNGIPDEREDDWDIDLPYDKDLKGYHFYWRYNLLPWRLKLGRMDAHQIGGNGIDKMNYAELVLNLRGPGWGELTLAGKVKRVEDTVKDNVYRVQETPSGRITWEGGYYPVFEQVLTDDDLDYKNSWVNIFYLDSRFTKVRSLNLTNVLKFERNWQKKTFFEDGTYQPKDMVDLFTFVSKADYTLRLGKSWSIIPKFKYAFIKKERNSLNIPDIHERFFAPILEVKYQITSRLVLKAGGHGLPGLEYYYSDLANRRNDFKRRLLVLSLSNFSDYRGYNVLTRISLTSDRLRFLDPHMEVENIDIVSGMLRMIIGF